MPRGAAMNDQRPSDGGPAFPVVAENGLGHIADGMSLRDWFAGQALAGIMASNPPRSVGWQERVEWDANSIANAMLAARAPTPER